MDAAASPTRGSAIDRSASPHKPPAAPSATARSYKLNIWDVGGQRTLRPYWRNYYEKTDGLIWVVDASDRARLADCAAELRGLLQEERLMGATLLILANKQDIPSALTLKQIEEVRLALVLCGAGAGAWG
jgi:GTPase SAR1 family protein